MNRAASNVSTYKCEQAPGAFSNHPDATGPLEGTIAREGNPLQLIALGESTVAGIGASTHEHALTGQLALALNTRCGRSLSRGSTQTNADQKRNKLQRDLFPIREIRVNPRLR